jgi:hypothetical protein
VFVGAPPDYPRSATGNYVEAGRLAQRWLPPGRRLGAFNAGFISLHAHSHTVINLDGLMNNGTYLREYFAKNRLDEYVHDVGIAWLALGVAGLVFRVLQLWIQDGLVTGLVWATKIITDPFHDIWLYHKAPLHLLRGELIDPMTHAQQRH